MRKFLISLAGLALVLVAVVLVAPSFIDWNAFRPEIAARLSTLTGRNVAIGGNVGFALLPTPRLNASQVAVAHKADGAPFLELDSIDVQVALLPLLAGDVEVQGMTLVRPRLALERRPDGRMSWEAGDSGFGLDVVRLDRVSVEDGTVRWQDGERQETITGIYANLSAVGGTVEAAGQATVRGQPVTVELSVQRRTSSGALPIRLALVLPEPGASLRYAGLVTLPDRVQGELRVEARDLGDALHVLGVLPDGADPALKRPMAARALVTAANGAVSATDLAVELGDERATGRLSVGYGDRIDVEATLAATRIDLDRWLTSGGGAVLPRLGSARLRIDLAADTVIWRGEGMRQARLQASLADGALSVDRFSALLPGAASVALSGTVQEDGGEPHLDLLVEASADDLRTTLGWLDLVPAGVPADKLRTGRLSVRASGTPKRFELRDLDLVLDGQRATGSLTVVGGARPAYGVRLQADQINLDAYVGTDGGANWLARLMGADATLDVRVGSLTVGGTTIGGLRLDTALGQGGLTIREASATDLAGAAVRVEGAVERLSPLRGLDLGFALRTDRPADLLALAGTAAPVDPARLGTVELSGRIAGDAQRLDVALAGALAGGTMELGGTVTGVETDPLLDIKLRVMHPRTAALLGLFMSDPPTVAALGTATDLYVEIAGGASALSFDNIQGFVAGVPLKGHVTLDNGAARPRATINLQTGNLPLAALMAPGTATPVRAPGTPWSTAPYDLAWLEAMDGTVQLTSSAFLLERTRMDGVRLQARMQDGILTVEQLTGTLLGGRLAASGSLEGRTRPVLNATIDLAGATLPDIALGDGLGIGSGRLDIDATLAGEGASELELVRSLAGEGTIALRNNIVSGIDLGGLVAALKAVGDPVEAVATVTSATMEGATRLAGIDARLAIENGIVRTENARLVADVGESRIDGEIDLPEWRIDMGAEVRLTVLRDVPAFTVQIVGPLDAPKRRLKADDLQDHVAKKAAEALVRRLAPQAPPASAPAAPQPRSRSDGAPTDASSTDDFVRSVIDSFGQP